MEHQFLFLLSSFLVLLLFISKLVHKRTEATQKLPPGPWKLPVLGSLHHMMGSKPPHQLLRDLAKKYGPLMHLQLGENKAIVVSSPKIAKEIFRNHDLAFLNRPDSIVARMIFYGDAGFAISPYGPYWREMRKISMLELLSAKKVRSFASMREDEIQQVVTSVQNESSRGQLINISQKFAALGVAIICRSLVGKPGNGLDQTLKKLLAEASENFGGLHPADLFPSITALQYITGLKPKLMKLHKDVDDILELLIKEHLDAQERTKGDDGGDSRVEDLMDVLLRLEGEDTEGHYFPKSHTTLKATICTIYAAGTDAISTTLQWAMSELTKNPRIMEKVQSELREALRGKKRIYEADIQQLEYIKLVIKETLRLHPPTPLLVPRACREECEIHGFKIPIGTQVLVNAWAIGRDPNYWHDAETFLPDRFYNNATDFMGSHFEFIPFGAGRRICPGITFTMPAVELPLAKLLYHFNWELPAGIDSNELDMSEASGIVLKRDKDLCLIATPYDPMAS